MEKAERSDIPDIDKKKLVFTIFIFHIWFIYFSFGALKSLGKHKHTSLVRSRLHTELPAFYRISFPVLMSYAMSLLFCRVQPSYAFFIQKTAYVFHPHNISAFDHCSIPFQCSHCKKSAINNMQKK